LLGTAGGLLAFYEIGESPMTVLESGAWWDAQLPEFPAPLCETCNSPMWVNKRFSTPVKSYRIGYQCRNCNHEHRLSKRTIQLRALEATA
jgi:hypothetical protein